MGGSQQRPAFSIIATIGRHTTMTISSRIAVAIGILGLSAASVLAQTSGGTSSSGGTGGSSTSSGTSAGTGASGTTTGTGAGAATGTGLSTPGGATDSGARSTGGYAVGVPPDIGRTGTANPGLGTGSPVGVAPGTSGSGTSISGGGGVPANVGGAGGRSRVDGVQSNPSAVLKADCERGWIPGMRQTKQEFENACRGVQ